MDKNIEYKDFIGIYDGYVDKELCFLIQEWFDVMHDQKMTITSKEESGITKINRNDELTFLPPINATMESLAMSIPLTSAYFKDLKKIINLYKDEYGIRYPLQIHTFKVHKVEEGQGYHEFHAERTNIVTAYRELAFMTYLESPEEGGETEFLHQKFRSIPKQGRTLIWPAGFTHTHRGGLVLKGRKLYITGWIELLETNPENYYV